MLQDIVRDLVRTEQNFSNIIDFIESPTGCNLQLFPIQKFIMKLIEGIPLSCDTYIDVYNETRSKILYTLNEPDYLKFLYDEGRCNQSKDPQCAFREVVWRGGRRGGKTTSVGLIGSWNIYKLIRLKDPHEHYNILPSTDIRIANIANTKKQNAIFYGEVKSHIRSKDFFLKHLYPSKSENSVLLYTQKELQMMSTGLKPSPSIILDSVTCNSSAARGGNNICVFLDEFAHFSKVLKSSRSDVEIYDSLTPSIGSFGNDGRIYIISSPLGAYGKMFELAEQAKKDRSMLSIEVPSWEINPNLTEDFLNDRIKRSRSAFMREFGAKYVSSVSSFIEEDVLLELSKKDFSGNNVYVLPKKSYYFYYGVDLGFLKDPTGISICHIDNGRVMVDFVDSLSPNSGKYSGQKTLDHDAVTARLKELFLDFPPFKGIYDQWEGYGFDAALKKASIFNFELTKVTEILNSQMYKTFYSLLTNGQLYINKELNALFDELLSLQKEVKNKFVIKVEAPQISGMHDDLSDACVRSVYLAYTMGILQNTPEVKYVSERQKRVRMLADYARRLQRGRL